ncbi:hypothetical protein [Chryseobacterium artocarpi]|uniref:hypothetical protein n=1 Tax=Chryseobacterium artocarpi TaxID=1414727 RepID=UPI003F3C70D4
MYEELLKEELKESSWVLVKSYTNFEAGGEKINYPRFEIHTVESKEDEYLLVKNINDDGTICLTKFYNQVSPVVLTEDYLTKLGLKDDEDVELDYNPEWKLYDFNGKKIAFNGSVAYEYNKQYDELHGLMVKPFGSGLKYIHQIQNLINS